MSQHNLSHLEALRSKSLISAQPTDELQRAKIDTGTPEDGAGWIEGYVAVYNNIDSQGDRIIPGAFAKTIAERVPAGKVVLMAKHFIHGGDSADVIGLVTSAKEDEHGCWIRAEFSAVQNAQDIRTKIREGMLRYLSCGIRVIRYEPVEEDRGLIYDLKEVALDEGTVTAFPANELASIISAKEQIADKPPTAPDESTQAALEAPAAARLSDSIALARVRARLASL